MGYRKKKPLFVGSGYSKNEDFKCLSLGLDRFLSDSWTGFFGFLDSVFLDSWILFFRIFGLVFFGLDIGYFIGLDISNVYKG